MKLFNLKSLSYCLLLGLVSFFFVTSCTTEESASFDAQEELLIEKGILLPESIFEKGETFVNAHLADIPESVEITYRNNYIVGQYLAKFEKIDEALNSLPKTANLSEVDLSTHLSSDQISLVASELINSLQEIQVRGICVPIKKWQWCCDSGCGMQWCTVGEWCW